MTISLADLKRSVDELCSAAAKFEESLDDVEILDIRFRIPGYSGASQIEARISGMRVVEAIRHLEPQKDMPS